MCQNLLKYNKRLLKLFNILNKMLVLLLFLNKFFLDFQAHL